MMSTVPPYDPHGHPTPPTQSAVRGFPPYHRDPETEGLLQLTETGLWSSVSASGNYQKQVELFDGPLADTEIEGWPELDEPAVDWSAWENDSVNE